MTLRFSDDQLASIPTLEEIIARNQRRNGDTESRPRLHRQYGDVGIAALSAATLCMKYGSTASKPHSRRDRAAA
ncbi:hypothetical protein [Roseibium sp.]|uniref:hypothetical protein n=1 Tax=Roseibium sp. TaxID=1936156 RepID=UPI003BA8FDBD